MTFHLIVLFSFCWNHQNGTVVCIAYCTDYIPLSLVYLKEITLYLSYLLSKDEDRAGVRFLTLKWVNGLGNGLEFFQVGMQMVV